ncbi:DUF2512 family protein [Brevibacillus sp. SYP-B805]|uniref:DUF2512 family protein n=1 Tax=Brevibacillus sp. SYP-B805 TaxID=1578199 RepID=UPI0013EE0453|nr:DUF2512 family protein [Brevibacillus sp. SYP-B805]NGQ93805.1 DUF2512 family protein [Brevibacillus sp. SYP-B805]
MNLLWKLAANGIIVIPGLLWSGTTLPFAVWAFLGLSLFSYLVGDRVILPKTNNTFASFADFLLSFSLLWTASIVFLQTFSLSGLFLTSFALSVVEYLYHSYLLRQSIDHTRQPG